MKRKINYCFYLLLLYNDSISNCVIPLVKIVAEIILKKSGPDVTQTGLEGAEPALLAVASQSHCKNGVSAGGQGAQVCLLIQVVMVELHIIGRERLSHTRSYMQTYSLRGVRWPDHSCWGRYGGS